MFDCAREAGSRTKVCTVQTMEMLVDLLRLYSDNVVSMLCGEYTDSSDRCDRVKLDFRPGKNSTRSKSFIKPILAILGNEGGQG